MRWSLPTRAPGAALVFGRLLAGTAPDPAASRKETAAASSEVRLGSDGFSAQEYAAMKERAVELRPEGRTGAKADGLPAVLDAIEKIAPADCALAERVHMTVTEAAPDRDAKTW
jgi:hypothetical protein